MQSLHYPTFNMYFCICDTVRSMSNKSKQDVLVKWNKHLYFGLTLSYQALSLIYISTEQWFWIQLCSFSFPMNIIFSFLLIHAALLSKSLFSVRAHLHAFSDIILHFMDVRRNCKVFSFFVKQAAINCFTHVCACVCYARTCMLMHMWLFVCTHAWHACVYVYATFTHQLFLRPPIFHFMLTLL